MYSNNVLSILLVSFVMLFLISLSDYCEAKRGGGGVYHGKHNPNKKPPVRRPSR